MRTKTYFWHETHNLPEKIGELTRRGWIWRSSRGTVKWTFTTSIHSASRSYPSGAEFVPVYVEEL